MESQGISHIHAHFCNHPAMAAYVIHHLTGIPYSFTAHGSDLHRDRHMLREKVRDASFVATVSQFNRGVIVTECGAEASHKVQVIHCGVDALKFRPLALGNAGTANASAKPAGLVLVCIGTLHEVKGQSYLLEACRLLRQRGTDVVCHLVGDGPDRGRLAELAERIGIGDAVRFHGACTRAEVVSLLTSADVAVAPSVPTSDGRREGIPVALMEAMSCGVPVVASRLSGIPELVEDGSSGLLTPPGDANAIADALGRLANDPALRRRLALQARKTVKERFDLRSNARQLASQFASRGPSAPSRQLMAEAGGREQ